MKFVQILFVLAFVGVSLAATQTGYEYDAQYRDGEVSCVNTTHFDVEGVFTGHSMTCQKEKELVKLVEKYMCFPGDATMELENGLKIAMRDLKVGDSVKVDHEKYETVIGWLHYEPDKNMTVTCLNAMDAETGTIYHNVCASDDHFIPVQGNLVRFRDVAPKDRISSAHGTDDLLVVDKYTMNAEGVFAPATPSGKIIVNDVLVSTYAYIAPNSFLREMLNDVLVKVPFDKCNYEGVYGVAYAFMKFYDFLHRAMDAFMSTLFVRN